MFENIKKCKKCGLCKHQLPLLDDADKCDVVWVGLSAKTVTCKGEKPLSSSTNSGRLLCRVEEKCVNISIYKTNLVKCVPLDDSGKIRYPNRQEIELCLPHLRKEINELTPRIVFLLGCKVADAVGKDYSVDFEKWDEFNYSYQQYNNMFLVPVHHPSYIHIYKRKRINEYLSGLEQIINRLL